MRSILIVLILCIAMPLLAQETELDKADQLTGKKKYDEALNVLREYDKAHPGDMEAHDRIQRIFKLQAKQDQAVAEYKQRYENDPSAINGYLYARIIVSPVEREAK